MVAQLPIIAVTAGDPCGIGPEVILKALRQTVPARLLLIGSLQVFQQTARRLRQPVPPWRVVSCQEFLARPLERRRLTFIDVASPGRLNPGRTGAAAGRAALQYLACAVELWKAGWIHGLVTAPVTKWAIERSRHRFIGQTEYLAEAMGCQMVVMMFASDRLRVVLLTRHMPLMRVGAAVTRPLIRQTLEITIQALQTQFRVPKPRIAICGLNPHAGERGMFGQEELTRLEPELRQLRAGGARIDGPLAADSVFAANRAYDAIICWYHDQALIPFKMAARDCGAQVSLGLPIIRTSPDHGSALDIAGRGIANPGSMTYALDLAAKLTCSPLPS